MVPSHGGLGGVVADVTRLPMMQSRRQQLAVDETGGQHAIGEVGRIQPMMRDRRRRPVLATRLLAYVSQARLIEEGDIPVRQLWVAFSHSEVSGPMVSFLR